MRRAEVQAALCVCGGSDPDFDPSPAEAGVRGLLFWGAVPQQSAVGIGGWKNITRLAVVIESGWRPHMQYILVSPTGSTVPTRLHVSDSASPLHELVPAGGVDLSCSSSLLRT